MAREQGPAVESDSDWTPSGSPELQPRPEPGPQPGQPSEGRAAALLRWLHGLLYRLVSAVGWRPREPLPACRNLPRGQLFFTARDGCRLHLRRWLPAGQPRGSCLLLHGLHAHINRPPYSALGRRLAEAGLAVFTFDLRGHGYSDGAPGLIRSYESLLDDATELVRLLSAGVPDQPRCRLELSPEARGAVAAAPMFILGQSLGGAIAALLGTRLAKQPGLKLAGTVLLCPAVQVDVPTGWLLALLRMMSWAFPRLTVPRWLDATTRHDEIWISPEDQYEYGVRDDYELPGGLGWHRPIRLGTAATLLDMVQELWKRTESIDFPVLALHDPEDQVCRYQGTERLLRAAGSWDKKLVPMVGRRHDLISNCTDELGDQVLEWMDSRLERLPMISE